MEFKSLVGTSLLLAACVALSGCQNSAPRRTTTPPMFMGQKSGTSNPPVVQAGGPSQNFAAPSGAPSAGMSSPQSKGFGQPISSAAPAGFSSSPPTVAPTQSGSQFRST